MSDYIQIQWTCGSIDEAREVAHKLVKERLVACANIIPWVESIFVWNGKIDVAQESKVIFKTRADLFEKVKDKILQHAKYEISEILQLPISKGNPDYLRWVDESLEIRESM